MFLKDIRPKDPLQYQVKSDQQKTLQKRDLVKQKVCLLCRQTGSEIRQSERFWDKNIVDRAYKINKCLPYQSICFRSHTNVYFF